MAVLAEKDQETIYNEIIRFYDMAENIVDVIEQNTQVDPEMQFQLATPLIEQVGDSADIIAQSYVNYSKGSKALPYDVKNTESAFRQIFSKICDFVEDVHHLDADNLNEPKSAPLKNRKIEGVMKAMLMNMMKDPEQLLRGPVRKDLTRLMRKLPALRSLIRAVRNIGDHSIRMVYLFFSPAIGLISQPERAAPHENKMMQQMLHGHVINAANNVGGSKQYRF